LCFWHYLYSFLVFLCVFGTQPPSFDVDLVLFPTIPHHLKDVLGAITGFPKSFFHERKDIKLVKAIGNNAADTKSTLARKYRTVSEL